ncbi:MAG: chromosomal replication initiator protein DnaA [Phycisphaerales bacterium]|jgi:chromosomal replication initiator protein|nr:chromosomal replication initiator protein DnaA [Phycisphaerales bacterium]
MSKNTIDVQQLREDMLAQLRRNYPAMCRRWFEDIEILGISGGSIIVYLQEDVQLKYLERSCKDQFVEAAQSVTGHLLGVRFSNSRNLEAHSNGTAVFDPSGSVISGDDIFSEMLISPDYSFDNFVVGPGNQLAHAASVAVAKKPSHAYNPLFIHGGVGLGKTHLLQAICQTAMRSNSSMQIYYVSCNGFLTQFLESVQAGEMSLFRNKFRAFDMLIIDDIHDLSNREQTQEEFFHTFNTLFQSGRQVVLSSDAPPSDIPHLEDRLISRFSCGLVAGIDPPGFETRVAIIKKKAALREIEIPDDVSNYIAARLNQNIRQLEGALTKLQGLSLLDGAPISVSMAKTALTGGSECGGIRKQITIQDILDAISTFFDVKLVDLLSKRRNKSITTPRQVGMWLARKHTRFSLEEIGGYFGGRDHTTVMHAIKTVDSKKSLNKQLDQDLTRLHNLLTEQDRDARSSTE